jgi:hypothetical protein
MLFVEHGTGGLGVACSRGDEGWQDFLTAAHQLLRARTDHGPSAPADAFFRVVDGLRSADGRTTVSAVVLDRLAAARPAGRTTGHGSRPRARRWFRCCPRWSPRSGTGVRAVRARQDMLTPQRMAWVAESVRPAAADRVGLRPVEARLDVRVQSADTLARMRGNTANTGPRVAG